MSRATGIPQPTLSRIENQKHADPRASNAAAIDLLYRSEFVNELANPSPDGEKAAA